MNGGEGGGREGGKYSPDTNTVPIFGSASIKDITS